MTTGMQTIVRKTTEGWQGAEVKPKGSRSWDSSWETIAVITDLSDGPSVLNAQMYAKLPTTKTDRPTDIQTRWLRPGGDATAREIHPIGAYTTWADERCGIETIQQSDLPLRLQMRQNGKTTIKVDTLITKMFAPAAYIAARIEP